MKQLVVSIAPDWNSATGRLQLFERSSGGWKAMGKPVDVLYGKNGLAWGRGVFGTDEPGSPPKVEHDGRAPAGVFKIGKIYTYDPELPKGSEYPFWTVTDNDAWIDDVNVPKYYNTFFTNPDPANPPPWFEKEKMRQKDSAYRWLVEIRHNADPPKLGFGSAIFFHIRRGPARKTAGCTTMAEGDLVKVIRWLRAVKNPHYVLLPLKVYQDKYKSWGLPSLTEAADLLPDR